MNTKPEMITRGNYDWSDEDHKNTEKLIFLGEYAELADVHARIASELMLNAHWKEGQFQTITNPALTEALIHAQLSTTFAIMANGKGI